MISIPRNIISFVLVLFAASGGSLRAQNAYAQTNLVCDPDYYASEGFTPQNQPGLLQDASMINAWGLSIRPAGAGGHFWIGNAGTGTSAEYIGDVNGTALYQDALKSVPLDTPSFTDHGYAFVTGLVYNSASDAAGQPVEFQVSGPAINATTGASLGTVTGAAKFIFATQDGCINAWRSNTTTDMLSAPVVIDYSKATRQGFPYAANSVFTGIAMTQNVFTSAAYAVNGAGGTGNLLFATDQRNNAIEVFDNTWHDVTSSFKFQTPADVGGLHVFNIADIDHHLFVTYAQFDPAGDEGQEQTKGVGLGKVVEYNEDGTLYLDFKDGANTPAGVLNEPWGVAIAPATFGIFGGDVLIANFGDGTVAAFNPVTGSFAGYLRGADGRVISIDGIWGLTFGNGVSLGDANALYFSAGPNGEDNGLFGKLTVLATPTDTPTLPTTALIVLASALVLFGGASRKLQGPPLSPAGCSPSNPSAATSPGCDRDRCES